MILMIASAKPRKNALDDAAQEHYAILNDGGAQSVEASVCEAIEAREMRLDRKAFNDCADRFQGQLCKLPERLQSMWLSRGGEYA